MAGAGTEEDDCGSIDLTLINSPAYVSAGVDFEESESDSMDGGANYRGAFTSTDFTFSATINVESAAVGVIMGTQLNSGTFRGWNFNVQADGSIRFNARETGGTDELSLEATTTNLSTATWYNIVIAGSSSPTASNVEIYVNGVLEAESAIADTLSSDADCATCDFEIGSISDGTHFDGINAYSRVWWGTKLNATQAAAVCSSDAALLTARSETPMGCT
ncbi:MAG: LamG domain-containing protein [Myxococcales bacterium]|nr:LamG domain-containing protein [Myxococcales bacterium]